MTFKSRYLLAKKNGERAAKLCRGDEISKRISKKYPISEQMAIGFNKEEEPEEYAAYQEYRKKIKTEVDAEIALFDETAKN